MCQCGKIFKILKVYKKARYKAMLQYAPFHISRSENIQKPIVGRMIHTNHFFSGNKLCIQNTETFFPSEKGSGMKGE